MGCHICAGGEGGQMCSIPALLSGRAQRRWAGPGVGKPSLLNGLQPKSSSSGLWRMWLVVLSQSAVKCQSSDKHTAIDLLISWLVDRRRLKQQFHWAVSGPARVPVRCQSLFLQPRYPAELPGQLQHTLPEAGASSTAASSPLLPQMKTRTVRPSLLHLPTLPSQQHSHLPHQEQDLSLPGCGLLTSHI